MPLLFLILFAQFDLIWSLKCFSGDPIFKNECTSLSYCLMIVSRSGRSQWSCDGNAFSQVSLCSTLGLQQDVEEETNLNVLSPRKRYPLISDAPVSRSEIPLVRSPFESTGRYSTGYRRSNSPYSQGLGKGRCFDGGELGRICCCSTDFCNRGVSVLPDTITFVFLSFIVVFINV
ncbi:unnamed protein product [Bursaphelenchus xylophilus]|uniref:(pine wood nematode) hypothetical protein n=1 Tax=Bursaphelenchus xylophilus TaxID=6326 RepID=A0A1I7RSZ1_BURXY|nr:unnamed protein product [Bursaphelenchus xylophilus]CAG9122725.1 unnamed protein product [Bursaphelenchus xylophilus]